MLTFVPFGVQLNVDSRNLNDSVPAIISRLTSQLFTLPIGCLEQNFWKKN